MKNHQRTLILILAILLAGSVTAWFLTRPGPPTARQGQRPGARPQGPVVDQSVLLTAQQLAPLAGSPQERGLARAASALADDEVDLAFVGALRNAAAQTKQLTGRALEAQQRVTRLETAVASDKSGIDQLTGELSAASIPRKDQISRRVDLMQAQQQLDQEELEDAQQDLARAGGDPVGDVRREMADHEASMDHPAPAAASSGQSQSAPSGAAGAAAAMAPGAAAVVGAAGSASAGQAPAQPTAPDNVVAAVRLWRQLRSDEAQIRQAQQAAQTLATTLDTQHDQLEASVKRDHPSRSALEQQAQQAVNGTDQASQQSAADALASVRRLTGDQATLAELDQRVQASQRLATIYGRWGDSIANRRLASAHALSWLFAAIFVIALVAIAAEILLTRFFVRVGEERKQWHTLRSIMRFFVRAAAVVLILVVIFGPPSELATVIALAGAGLTVVLKDFIVGFFGWFALLGRNGIRVGDWVEIEGVTGEVVEIGLFQTVLLETGSWSDASRLTGRRVSFNNGFAIEGHYFNFSTSERWIWDELQIAVPSGRDPFLFAESIRKMAAEETKAYAEPAQQQLRRVSGGAAVSFSAEPSVNVKPDGQGAQVVVRYLTRAGEQHAVGARLFRRILDSLDEAGASQVAKSPATEIAEQSPAVPSPAPPVRG